MNASSHPIAPKVQIWSVSVAGGEPKLLGDGDESVIAPLGDRVAFIKQDVGLKRRPYGLAAVLRD